MAFLGTPTPPTQIDGTDLNASGVNLPNGSTAQTQAHGNASSLIANCAFVQDAVTGFATEAYVDAAISKYTSGELGTVANSTTYTATHSLGAIPVIAQAVLRCSTAEQGYSIGDEIVIGVGGDSAYSGGAVNIAPATLYTTATTIGLSIGTHSTTILEANHKTTGAEVSLTAANWQVVLKAIA